MITPWGEPGETTPTRIWYNDLALADRRCDHRIKVLAAKRHLFVEDDAQNAPTTSMRIDDRLRDQPHASAARSILHFIRQFNAAHDRAHSRAQADVAV